MRLIEARNLVERPRMRELICEGCAQVALPDVLLYTVQAVQEIWLVCNLGLALVRTVFDHGCWLRDWLYLNACTVCQRNM